MPSNSGAPGQSETVVKTSAWLANLFWFGLPLLGALLGWGVRAAAAWVTTLPWAPFQGPGELIASIPAPWATVAMLLVGAVGGLVLAFLAMMESLEVVVADDRVTLKRGDVTQSIKRDLIHAAFLDGDQLILLGRSTEELARSVDSFELGEKRLGSAFRAHGYAWLDGGDPHKDEYRRWVEDLPDIPGAANALLKARARALSKGDEEDAAQLRAELAKLGIMLRDEKKRQFWRPSR